MKKTSCELAAWLCLVLLAACSGNREGNYPVFPEQPPGEARPGFEWEIVSGAGLQFRAQSDGRTHVVTDGLLEEAVVVKEGSSNSGSRLVIKIFHIADGDIEDVLDYLRKSPGWNEDETCKFRKTDCARKGVTRYVLVPVGDYADRVETAARAKKPMLSTCGGWGDGNGRRRYFEIHDSHPDKALFVDAGWGNPLFDPESIVLTDVPVKTVRGELAKGRGTFSFTACNDTLEYLVKDLTGTLARKYGKAGRGDRPLYAELKVRDMGKSLERTAEGRAGVYEAMEVDAVKAVAVTAGKDYESRKTPADSLKVLVTSASLDIIYSPTPGAKNVEISAPGNILPFLEVYVGKNGTLLVNMKRFPEISSDTPFSIELKAPPMDTFRNKGKGTLILKDGAYSDGDVRVAATGPVICGSVTCRDLHVAASSGGSFRADRHLTCRDLTLDTGADASIDLVGGVACRLLDAHAEAGSNISARKITATDIAVQSFSSGNIILTGSCTKAVLANASRGTVDAGGLQAMDAEVTMAGESTTVCHATRKLEADIRGGTGTISYKGHPRVVCRTPSARDCVKPVP